MTLKFFLQLVSFLWLLEPLAAAQPSYAKSNCNDTCGNVTIPYPFGMGAGCFLDEWYQVSCLYGLPYLITDATIFGIFQEVLDVSIDPPTILIKFSNFTNYVCKTSTLNLTNLSGSPLYYPRNGTFFGCGNIILFADQTILGGCISTCDEDRRNNSCQFSIPSSVQSISLNYSNSGGTNDDSCGWIFFGDDSSNSTSNISYSDPFSNMISFGWGIQESAVPETYFSYCDPDFYGRYRCSCRYCAEGNPYIPQGCRGDNCISNSGRRSYPTISRSTGKRLITLVVGGTILGILFLATTTFLLYKKIKKRRVRKRKEKFFVRNGGLLLQQQLSIDESMVDKVKFFTSSELDKATDYFNENRVLGQGGQGTVYKGMLVDGKIVAVKKSKLVDENQLEQFINEVVILSQINHRNVVKLLGCCLETDVPLLVYEFIPNGTLYELMHNEKDEFLMSWEMRLRIATEASGALAYLHYATSVPIYHRDIKSSNILLDEKHKAKVSDFGISRHVTTDQTHLTTMVKGTFGYLDPEYFQSNQFTEKSDVYSFGVVLVELLTRQKPISLARNTPESGLSLATRFLISMEEDQLDKILDDQILDKANAEKVKAVAILARRCLSMDGKKRPTMKEVALELEAIKMSHFPSVVRENLEENKHSQIELVLISDGFYSSTTANDTVASSSDIYPLLSDTF